MRSGKRHCDIRKQRQRRFEVASDRRGRYSGQLVRALIDTTPGKNLIAYREWMTLEEMVRVFAEVTGLHAQYVTLLASQPDIPLPEGLEEEIDDNWACFNEIGYEAKNDPSVIHPDKIRHAFFFKESWMMY